MYRVSVSEHRADYHKRPYRHNMAKRQMEREVKAIASPPVNRAILSPMKIKRIKPLKEVNHANK